MLNIQAYISMASALILFIGGMVVVFAFPSRLSATWRVIIALAVAGYFLFRMRQTFSMLRRDRQEQKLESLNDERGDEIDDPKTP